MKENAGNVVETSSFDRMNVKYQSKPCYDIVFRESFDDLAREICNIREDADKRKICIVTDSNVGPLYLKEVQDCLRNVFAVVETFTIPAGEENKTLDQVRNLYRFLIEHHFDRKDMLLALGGGVIGDMTGFTAATYLRGVDFVQVPTTLLSQADSSIGGKTGVDFDGFKNMVGAFKMPRLVYMDFCTLKTLDGRQFSSGFAEVMKNGLLKDAKFYSWLVDHSYEITDREIPVLREMLYRSCDIKRQIVEKDPTEQKDRALLNLGHTLGHAIEKYSHFRLAHGECVALGCVAAAFISWKREMLSMEEFYEIRDMFVPFGLPISINAEDIDIPEVIRLTKSDKKADAGVIKFILLKKVGKAVIETGVTEAEMEAALKELVFDEND